MAGSDNLRTACTHDGCGVAAILCSGVAGHIEGFSEEEGTVPYIYGIIRTSDILNPFSDNSGGFRHMGSVSSGSRIDRN
jgi:hypothetical protein